MLSLIIAALLQLGVISAPADYSDAKYVQHQQQVDIIIRDEVLN